MAEDKKEEITFSDLGIVTGDYVYPSPEDLGIQCRPTGIGSSHGFAKVRSITKSTVTLEKACAMDNDDKKLQATGLLSRAKALMEKLRTSEHEYGQFLRKLEELIDLKEKDERDMLLLISSQSDLAKKIVSPDSEKWTEGYLAALSEVKDRLGA